MSIKHSDEKIKQAVVEWINSDAPLDVIATKYGIKYNTLYGRAKNLLAHIARLPTEAKCLIREKGLTNYFDAAPAPAKIPADLQAVKALIQNSPANLSGNNRHEVNTVSMSSHAAPVDAQGGGGYIPKSSKFDECRTLLFDIETLPNEGYFFDTFSKMPIPTAFIKRAKSICTLAYKWLGDTQTHVLIMDEAYKDGGLLEVFFPEYEQAHYVVGHYADGFDVPFIDARLQVNGLPPLPNKMILDTYKIAKKKFGRSLNSNRLDHLGDVLGLGRKNKTDAHLWVGCANNEPSAIEEMAAYNVQDVDLLEAVFLKLQPQFSKKINMNKFIDDAVNRCKTCGNDNLRLIGYEMTASTKRPQFRCGDCGAVSSFSEKQVKL
jgi:uncharacterized protein YprB with RNaseH-like and TPR domain